MDCADQRVAKIMGAYRDAQHPAKTSLKQAAKLTRIKSILGKQTAKIQQPVAVRIRCKTAAGDKITDPGSNVRRCQTAPAAQGAVPPCFSARGLR